MKNDRDLALAAASDMGTDIPFLYGKPCKKANSVDLLGPVLSLSLIGRSERSDTDEFSSFPKVELRYFQPGGLTVLEASALRAVNAELRRICTEKGAQFRYTNLV